MRGTAWLLSPVRRVLDVAAAMIGLALLSPILAALTVAIRRTMGAPVLFHHERAGLTGRTFRMTKFRSMTAEADEFGQPIDEADRITGLGRWMRNSSLDELPELFNVLRGEMSLVGPRPLLPEYNSLYSPEQAERLSARPGITGLAQVRGRNALTWEEKFRFDAEYVRTATPWLDLQIIAWTLVKVLRRDGISAEGHTSSPKFTGQAPSPDPHTQA